MKKDNISKPIKGLHTDNSYQEQPEGTFRFALNSVDETDQGDSTVQSNEESNEICTSFPEGYIPIGKEYIGDGETAVLLVNESETLSEIGILHDDCTYVTHVNFNLGLKLNHQVDIVYRLRRGCEKVIYFVDGYNHPMLYNFNKPYLFKDDAENWDATKFRLFKGYNKIPVFSNLEIVEAGNLNPGSYNFAIQYLDESLNPTEWITTSDTMIIYNDDLSKEFSDIRGSTNAKNFYQDFGKTNKAVKISLSNLDTELPYYRIAAIHADNGSGEVSKVILTNEISTQISTFTYSGSEGFSIGTEEEIQQFRHVIRSAKHIEQLENRLILSDVTGKKVNWCKFQKYASKIKADLVTERIILNDINSENNPKRGQIHNEKVGYMPGEIYSFGIEFIFDDGVISPTFHIPGRNPGYDSQMSLENELSDTYYIDNETCTTGESFWGVDSQGEELENSKVRHHRFPLRSDVNKPLVTKEGTSNSVINNNLYVDISGTIVADFPDETIDYLVTYTINGTQYQSQLTITVSTYDPAVGITGTLIDSSIDAIVVVSIEEIVDGVPTDPSLHSGLTYTSVINSEETSFDDSIYSTEIFGIKFSDIDIPTAQDLQGEKIIGYRIVRNERNEDNKTILDTAILTPLVVEDRNGFSRFLGHGHIVPHGANLKEDIFALIHPEHKFNEREYRSVTKVIKQGEFRVQNRSFKSRIIQDVAPGTSYDPEVHKKKEADDDGLDLHVYCRDNKVDYFPVNEVIAEENQITEVFYLNSLFSKSIIDANDNRKEVFNVSGDNKAGFLQLNYNRPDVEEEMADTIPSVILKRELSDPYGNFRVLPYYRETVNHSIVIGQTDNETTVFNGDSYVSPMRYTSSMFYELRMKDRDEKSGVWNIILGALAAIAGVLVTVFTAGAGVAAGIALIGFGAAQIASGIQKEQLANVYQDLYEAGLKDTVADASTQSHFGDDGDDDEIRWFSDTVTSLWFESSVNTNWRMGATAGITDFLNAPGTFLESLPSYLIEKVSNLDPESAGGRTYQGFAKAELYDINPDYFRRDRQKLNFHLPLEYDCCTECIEEFPQRYHWSEPSFQEELTDNYRIFLPNNYKDMEGHTGPIVNMFRIQNNLYLHTKEALWHIPQTLQERVTGDIVSFIGTGEFLSIPPRLIVDGEGNSAGTKHKWGVVKTPYGVFFICENEGKVYKFDGNKLDPISNIGEYNWFKNNIEIFLDKEYQRINRRPYPYRDNPSNKLGTGFIATYDSRKERIIFTKKDFSYGDVLADLTDYQLCNSDNTTILFNDYEATKTEEAAQGWNFIGIENCEMNFEKVSTKTIQVETFELLANDTDIIVQLDMSGSFSNQSRSEIKDSVETWLSTYENDNPDWEGNLYFCEHADWYESQRWVKSLKFIKDGTNIYDTGGNPVSALQISDNILVISFVNENDTAITGDENKTGYHTGNVNDPIVAPEADFITDYNEFVTLYNTHTANGGTFKGLIYPIVYTEEVNNALSVGPTNGFLQHVLAAMKGVPYTTVETAAIEENTFLSSNWNDLLTSLQGVNPYPDNGLENYGWAGRYNRGWDGTNEVITPVQFSEDIEDYLESTKTTVITDVEVPDMIYKSISGTPIVTNNINRSWTKSFSLKKNAWRSYHSYMPNFYIETPDKFYSWINGNRNIWKHNRIGHYQTFYGIKYPFILEYVSLSNPLTTRIWNFLRLVTEAKKYNEASEQFTDQRFITFNKGVFYNSRQCSGVLDLIVKDTKNQEEDYLSQQIENTDNDAIIIDRNERDWTLNDLRDNRVDYEQSLFISRVESLQANYFIDKIVNQSSIDFNKDWSELESFRDKYLVVRLIFDNFDDIKLLLNYSIENENISPR